MASKIVDNLYLGDALDAEMLQFANPLNITLVVNVAMEADDPVAGITNIHIAMEDGEIPTRDFVGALAAIADNLNSGRVLVHCLMGASRSVVLVSLHLAITEGISFDLALKQVKRLRDQKGDPAPETMDSARRYLRQLKDRMKKSKSGGR